MLMGLPDKLYKYRKVNRHTYRIFTHNELYFPSPKKFNDPFDCKVDFSLNRHCCDKDIKIHLEKAKQSNSAIDVEKEYNNAKRNKSDFLKYLKSTVSDLQAELWKNLGVMALSTKRDDILMWSHYGDEHKGICIEFDRALLEKTISKCGLMDRVRYTQDYLSFNKFNNAMPGHSEINQKKAFDAFVLRKSIHWEYEQEIRAIINVVVAGKNTLKIPHDLITGVIFGCKMDDTDKVCMENRFKKLNKKISLYYAKEDENTFTLDIKEMKQS